MFDKKISLGDVFGMTTDIPKYTYVDRQELDSKFKYYLSSQRHIVVHGASKQGKSCLRKNNIDSANCVVVQCLPSMEEAENIWCAALEVLGKKEISRAIKTDTTSANLESEAGGQATLPLLGNIGAKIKSGAVGTMAESNEEALIKGGSLLPTLAVSLKESGKRLILEDFHYLSDEVRKNVAFGLKALYEEMAYVIIIGVWSEQDLITYYNGDLTGRIEEFNLIWRNEELGEVLSKGEGALNVEFALGFKNQLLESSFNNIGLLQRLAEKVCLEAGVLETQPAKVIISNISLLRNAEKKLVSDIRQRYTRIAEVFRASMRSDAKLLIYARIYNELIQASASELINGIPYTVLLERIQKRAQGIKIRTSDLTSALDNIERLQAKKNITPLLVSYSKSLKILFLNDREFMFYKEKSGDVAGDLMIDTEVDD